MKRYGCFDHAPYQPAQVLHGHDSRTGEPIQISIPNRGQQTCQYRLTELGRVDESCAGCTHKDDAQQ